MDEPSTPILDTDEDGIADETDTDDDNDGVPDSSDAFPLDASGTSILMKTELQQHGYG